MYDVKPEVYTLLSTIPSVTVSDAFPKGPAETPRITFGEANNSNYRHMSEERQSAIIIQIDVWHTKSTGTLAAAVNEKMTSIGFLREFASDLTDPSGIKRKTMRYRGIVDAVTKLVHQ